MVTVTVRRSPGLAASLKLWLETEIPKSLTNSWSHGKIQQDGGKTNQKLTGKSFLS